MRIIFMGTPEIAAGILEKLLINNYNIVGVVTQPDKKIGRKQLLHKSEVKLIAEKYGVLVIQPLKIRSDYQDVLELNPDLILTCAYGQIIPKVILDYPKYHCINCHGSLLPKYRGGSPIQTAIKNGDKFTGMTLMYMSEKMDDGDILISEKIEITEDETTESLFKKMGDVASKLLLENLDRIINKKIKPIPQDITKVTYAYNITKEQEYIDFYQDYNIVYNHIRSLISWPIGNATINGKKLKFHKAHKSLDVLGKPGEFIGLVDNSIAIGAKKGTILVDEIQVEGKNKQFAKDFYNGIGRNLVGKYFDPILTSSEESNGPK